MNRPPRIAVYDFAVDASEVTRNQDILQQQLDKGSDLPDRQRRIDLGHEVAKQLSEHTVKDLQKMGFVAVRLPRNDREVPRNSLIVHGRFIDVDEGNRLKRLVIGFGVGKSRLDTETEVFQILTAGDEHKVLEFKTHSESGKLPGAAITMGAGAAVTGGASVAGAAAASGMAAGKAYTSQVDYLAQKTSDQITAYLSEYFAKEGWIPNNQAQKANID